MQSVEIIKEPKIWRPVAVVCVALREKFFASVQSFCTAFNLSTLQERQLQAVFSFVVAIMVELLNKQGPLDKQQRREAGSFVDQDQQYF